LSIKFGDSKRGLIRMSEFISLAELKPEYEDLVKEGKYLCTTPATI